MKIAKALIKKPYHLTLGCLLSVYLVDAYADPANQNFGDMLINFSNTFPALFNFITSVCAVIGVMMIVFAFFKLKHLADMRGMMSGQQDVGKIFGLLFVGVAFLWMPYMLNALTYTVYGMGITSLSHTYTLASSQQTQYYTAFLQLMQLVGLISFIKGWMILAGMAKGQSQPGTLGKAGSHILAGLFLFNLLATMHIIENTIGIKFLF